MSLIALMAASLTLSGVGKSGCPMVKLIPSSSCTTWFEKTRIPGMVKRAALGLIVGICITPESSIFVYYRSQRLTKANRLTYIELIF